MSQGWTGRLTCKHPLRMDLDLDMARDLGAPAQARKAITGLRGHVDGDVLSDTILLVSELVSNSVKYGEGDILLRARTRGPRQVLVEVVDDGRRVLAGGRRPSRFQAAASASTSSTSSPARGGSTPAPRTSGSRSTARPISPPSPSRGRTGLAGD